MTNYYIEHGYTLAMLATEREQTEARLRQLGELYDNPLLEDLTPAQEQMRDLNNRGYDYNEQIYDTYADLGTMMEAEKQLTE